MCCREPLVSVTDVEGTLRTALLCLLLLIFLSSCGSSTDGAPPDGTSPTASRTAERGVGVASTSDAFEIPPLPDERDVMPPLTPSFNAPQRHATVPGHREDQAEPTPSDLVSEHGGSGVEEAGPGQAVPAGEIPGRNEEVPNEVQPGEIPGVSVAVPCDLSCAPLGTSTHEPGNSPPADSGVAPVRPTSEGPEDLVVQTENPGGAPTEGGSELQ